MTALRKVILVDASGNPIYTVPAQMDDTDKLAVSLYGKGTVAGDTPILADATRGVVAVVTSVGSAQADGHTNTPVFLSNPSGAGIFTSSLGKLFNGSSWDRDRGAVGASLAASAARIAELTTSDLTNYNHRGLIMTVNVTARAAATTLTPKMQFKDPVSGEYLLVWTAAAAINTADNTFMYQFYPTPIPTTALVTEHLNVTIPRTLRFVITPNDANSVTYSVGTDLIL